MLHFEEALKIVLTDIETIGTARVSITNALNRILAEDLISDIDMPPFNKAAMDGFACRRQDLKAPLEVIEEIPAGATPLKKIGPGQCSRIMTGAPVPEGADFILMKEYAVTAGDDKIICTKELLSDNICLKGEDNRQGDVVLTKGTLLKPQHIAILASVGCTELLVYKVPSVAVISTGNELVEPNIKPEISKIRNSNGYQIIAQCVQMGLYPEYLGIVADDGVKLTHLLSDAITKYDVVIMSGGVSVGDYDYVPEVLKKLGVDIRFHGVQAKPGKHLLFGRKGNHFVVGLPGNPVSSFVQFEILVQPLLQKLMGQAPKQLALHIPLDEDYKRKKDDVLAFSPVQITENGSVKPLEYHGSAHIHAYVNAHGIMEVPIGIAEYKKGDIVRVRPL
jgi:molybdopterin molybdotransferase